MPTPSSSPARRGVALVLAISIIVMLTGMALTLSGITTSRIQEQQARKQQVQLLMAAESALNETVAWMQFNRQVRDYLENMTVTSVPATANWYPYATSTSPATIVTSNLSGTLMPAAYPALSMRSDPNSAISATNPAQAVPGNGANQRNYCLVQSKIIKVVNTAPGNIWPDGNERFMIYSTARQGTAAATTRGQRVWATIKVGTNRVFTQAMFSSSSYDIQGRVMVDSWNSNGGTTAYAATVHPGGVYANNGGDVASNGDVNVAANPTEVWGAVLPSIDLTNSPVPYEPPATYDGAVFSGAITILPPVLPAGAPVAEYHYRSTNNLSLTLSGSGTVMLYVDGALDLKNIIFQPGSTVKLQIYQGVTTDPSNLGGGNSSFGDPINPSRLQIMSNYIGTGARELSINANTQMSAVIYAPNAGIKLTGTADFYGSVISQDLSQIVNGSFKFHFDESLRDLGLPMPRLTAIAWFPRSLSYAEVVASGL